jgi:hypothetical protein
MPVTERDGAPELRQRSELVDVVTPEVVLKKELCCGAERHVGAARGEQQGHRVDRREERGVYRHHPT